LLAVEDTADDPALDAALEGADEGVIADVGDGGDVEGAEGVVELVGLATAAALAGAQRGGARLTAEPSGAGSSASLRRSTTVSGTSTESDRKSTIRSLPSSG